MLIANLKNAFQCISNVYVGNRSFKSYFIAKIKKSSPFFCLKNDLNVASTPLNWLQNKIAPLFQSGTTQFYHQQDIVNTLKS